MTKRIFDIIPPEEAEIVSNETEGNFNLDQGPTEETPVLVKLKKPKRKFFWVQVGCLIVAAGFIAGAILIPAKAEVKIFPKTEDAQFSGVILVSADAPEINFETQTLPGKIFSDSQSYSQNYSATGNGENSTKAKGTIRVYNKYSPADSLTLKNGTHFLSSPKGLSYHSLTVINIPAATISGSKITPGFVDIQIEADEAGEEYNLSSASFSIPKLNGTAYYSTTWAETRGEIKGGSSSNVKIVTKKDLDSAKESFKSQSFTSALTSLKGVVENGYAVFDKAVSQEMTNLNMGAKEKDAVASFEVKGIVVSNIVAFRDDDFKVLAESLVSANQTEAKPIVPGSLSCEVSDSKKDSQGRKVELEINCKAKTYWVPDSEFLLKNLGGKNKDYSASIIKNFSGVNNVEIKLWPFWKFNLPTNSQNIDIKVNFD